MKLLVLAFFAASLFGAEAQPFQLVTLQAPVSFQGATFSAVTVRIQEGSVPTQPAGYVFRPARVTPSIAAVPAVDATETTPAVPEIPAQPERIEEIGGEYFAADPAPSLAAAPAALAAYCAAPVVASDPVQSSVSPRQIRLWLIGQGINLASIDAALTSDADKVEWQYATSIDRANPLVNRLASALGIDADKAFREASKL